MQSAREGELARVVHHPEAAFLNTTPAEAPPAAASGLHIFSSFPPARGGTTDHITAGGFPRINFGVLGTARAVGRFPHDVALCSVHLAQLLLVSQHVNHAALLPGSLSSNLLEHGDGDAENDGTTSLYTRPLHHLGGTRSLSAELQHTLDVHRAALLRRVIVQMRRPVS